MRSGAGETFFLGATACIPLGGGCFFEGHVLVVLLRRPRRTQVTTRPGAHVSIAARRGLPMVLSASCNDHKSYLGHAAARFDINFLSDLENIAKDLLLGSCVPPGLHSTPTHGPPTCRAAGGPCCRGGLAVLRTLGASSIQRAGPEGEEGPPDRCAGAPGFGCSLLAGGTCVSLDSCSTQGTQPCTLPGCRHGAAD